MKRESARIDEKVKMQNSKLAIMRQSTKERGDGGEEDLILSFDEVFNPVTDESETISSFKPLGYISIVLISIIPSFGYLLICFFLHRRR